MDHNILDYYVINCIDNHNGKSLQNRSWKPGLSVTRVLGFQISKLKNVAKPLFSLTEFELSPSLIYSVIVLSSHYTCDDSLSRSLSLSLELFSSLKLKSTKLIKNLFVLVFCML